MFFVKSTGKEVRKISSSLERPKLKIEKTKSEMIWDLIGYLSYLGSIAFLIFIWNSLPDKVPAHFNAAGEVDRWGSKTELLILPIIGALVAGSMQIVERFPQIHNYPERLNEDNARDFYLVSRKMTNQIKNISLIIFALISFESVAIALDWGSPFGSWFLPIILVGVAIPIIYGFIKQRKIR